MPFDPVQSRTSLNLDGVLPHEGVGAVVVGWPVCPLPGEISDGEALPPARPSIQEHSGTALQVSSIPMGRVLPPDVYASLVVGTVVGRPPQPMIAHEDVEANPSSSAPSQVVFGGRDVVVNISDEDDCPAEDPTCLATVVCCVCPCSCFGLSAIAKSRQVARKNGRGEFGAAHKKRKEAMRLIYMTVAVGVVVNVIYFFLRHRGSGGSSFST